MFYRFRRIRKVFQVKLHREFLYEHGLLEIPAVAPPSGLTMRLLKMEESHLLRKVWNVNMEQIRVRFERGDLCYAGFLDDTICSYRWVQYSGTHFFQQINSFINVESGQGWIYHGRTADWAKGRGINSFVFATILTDAKRMGKTKLFVYTSAKNNANQKGLAKSGFKKVKEFISIWFWQRYFLIRKKVVH